MSAAGLNAAQAKMRAAQMHSTAIDVFTHYYRQLETGATGMLAESDIAPLAGQPVLADLEIDPAAGPAALDATVVIKLNGGLGTSMGMSRAKSLLTVRDGLTFLDLIARQVMATREALSVRLPVIFMDSFRTREDTLGALSAYPDLGVDEVPLDFLQSREPKLRADDLGPVEWSPDPSLEWCPPGHGDLYSALAASGTLRQLLEAGYRYAFVSNADNLGATAAPSVAGWFAESRAPFASEVCRRTPADRKGGHLAIRQRDGQLVLRESAQTAPGDAASFADIERHRFFNTNNLWLDLRALDETLRVNAGVLGLPLIRNEKTVDPADKRTPKVIQIETAMGAAVEVFAGSQAIEVDRSRFLPVKTTSDLLVLRSDVYELADDCSVRLAAGLRDAPLVELDPAFYTVVADFEPRFADGAPSLVEARSLRVMGDWTFRSDVVVRGDAEVTVDGSPGQIGAGQVIGSS